jgi:hypothetical protein
VTFVPTPDVWKNPLARCGFIVVNVLIGDGIESRDRDLFFGPLNGDERWVELDAAPMLPRLLADFGLFSSAKEASRKGYLGPVRDGFTDLAISKMHRVTILNISRSSEVSA